MLFSFCLFAIPDDRFQVVGTPALVSDYLMQLKILGEMDDVLAVLRARKAPRWYDEGGCSAGLSAEVQKASRKRTLNGQSEQCLLGRRRRKTETEPWLG